MIILGATTDELRVVLNAAHTTNALQCVASWRDITTTTYVPGRSLQTTNGATPVVAVASPAASTQRVIDHFSVYNADTITHTVTIRYYDGTNNYSLWVGSLAAGERVEYTDANGFSVFTASGVIKQAQIAGKNVRAQDAPLQYKWLTAEYTHTTGVTLSTVTGLTVSVTAGRYYWFRAMLNIRTSFTTTGVRGGLNHNGVTVATTGYAAAFGSTPLTTTTEQFIYGSVSGIPAVGASSVSANRVGSNLLRSEMLLVPENTVTDGVRVQVAAEIAENIIVCPGSCIVYAEYTP